MVANGGENQTRKATVIYAHYKKIERYAGVVPFVKAGKYKP